MIRHSRRTGTGRLSRTGILVLVVSLLLGLGWGATAVPAASAAPPRGGLGQWSVTALGGHRYAVSWRSPVRLPLSSDRPQIVGPAGVTAGAPTIASDGRTVRSVITTGRAAQLSRLHVLLSGDRLDVAGRDTVGADANRRVAQASAAAPARATLPQDPGVPGPYAITTSNYVRPSVKLSGMPAPIEMVGHVVEPVAGAATGPRPLVLFLHGRHEVCYQVKNGDGGEWPCTGALAEIPSQLGYDYIQRLLASQGYTTVSIRVNGINAQDYALDDGGAGARAAIVRRHLDYWTTIAAAHQVDLSRVILVGHSRGGEGVNRASIEIGLSAPYRIVGQVLIAPTDFAEQTAPYVPTVTLLPYCDGDVYDLQGQHFTDVGRDITTADTSLKSSVLIMGANHNFFNTEWTPGQSVAPSNDDWANDPKAACGTSTPQRLTATEQQKVGKAYVAGAVDLFAAGHQRYLPLYDGTAATVSSIGDATTYSAAIGGGRSVRRPDAEFTLALTHGARTDLCRGVTDTGFQPDACGSSFGDLISPHWAASDSTVPNRRWFRMSWTAAGQSGGMVLRRPLDLRQRMLDLRTAVDPRQGDVKLRVRITDTAGASATLTPSGGSALRALLRGDFVTKVWAQTLRVDPSSAGVDLSRVIKVELIGDSSRGTVYVADLASVPTSLSSPAAVRVPRLSIGTARVKEGNGSGWAVGRVPWTLSGPTAGPASFTVVTTDDEVGSVRRYRVDIAQGQTSGSIDVGYLPDRRDDPDESITTVLAWSGPNVITDRYVGGLIVLDDDPTPSIVLRRVSSRISEGRPAAWKVKLGAAVDYPIDITGRVVKGSKHELTGRDVPKSWFTKFCAGSRDRALSKSDCFVYGQIDPGRTSATVELPTIKDHRREGAETVTVRFKINKKTVTSTVTVRASA